MLDIFINSITTGLFPQVYKILVVVLPLIVPVILFVAFWVIRLRYIQMRYIEKQKKCLLEIKLPKEITKSPAAMEIFFANFFQGGAANYTEAYLDGRTRAWFSCELVSIEGMVHFYIWISNAGKFKDLVETQLYAQYPNIEVFEVEDYTKDFAFDTSKYSLFGSQFKLAKADAFPIKTYIDYGLGEDQKDEYKIDPMNSVLEFLGSMRKGENVWIQILIRKHEKEGLKHGRLKEKKDWTSGIDDEIKKIRESTMTGDEESGFKFPNPTKAQNEIIAALDRSKSKVPFDCMVRGIYLTESSAFRPSNIGGLLGTFRQYGSNTLNGFKPSALTDTSDEFKDLVRFLPFLKKRGDKKTMEKKKDIFHAYKLRSFFEWPYKGLGEMKPFVLTTEELATIFHFPSGMVSQTPTLKRVGSKKAEAPSNLPI
jgi:hypothetical protein